MKKILLSLTIIAVMGITAKVEAQCTVSNVIIDVNSCTPVSGNLQVNFDVSFNITNNNGNKYIFIHAWKASQYPNYWNCSASGTSNENKPPKNTTTGPQANQALANSFLNIAIDNNLAGNAIALVNSYNPDPTNVTITTVGGISKVVFPTFSTITLTGVSVTIPGIASCNDPISVISDVWSSQASDGQVVHCVNCNIKQFFNDPVITGFKNCLTPRQISFGVVTNGNVPASYTYQIYRDVAPLGVFDGNDVNVTLTAPNADIITNSTAGSGGQVGRVVGFTGNNAPGEKSDYWVVVTPQGGGGNSIAKLMPNGNCGPLPVDFKSFTATRSRSNVMLKWETSSEKNNSGFAVERSLDNATWQEIAFVPTQATGGNSSTDLSYQYIDLNNSKGVSQYRIKQVDIDSRSKYSEIRSVKGDGQMGNIIVYPNPTADGRINVVFDDANTIREIAVVDMSGRTVKQIRGISNNNVTIENLQPGMYSLRVFVPGTGEQTVQKIVVNKR